jgi:uncharacterized protein
MADTFNLSRLDVATLARSSGMLQSGRASGAESDVRGYAMERLAAEACVPDGLAAVYWQLHAELRDDASGAPQPWLLVDAGAQLKLVCQRCLEPVSVPLLVNRWFRFVADEDTASAEDDVSDEDVLVLESRFDATTLIEDELIMAIPLVPMHGECPVSVPMSVVDPGFVEAESERPHPFAGLEKLAAKKLKS